MSSLTLKNSNCKNCQPFLIKTKKNQLFLSIFGGCKQCQGHNNPFFIKTKRFAKYLRRNQNE